MGKQMRKPEILSPAGSWETLKAAVAAGADAVYFGGPVFNARHGAANFTCDDIAAAVAYCHVRGVKAYITFNTMLFSRELPRAMELLAAICAAGADAAIVQDVGLAALIRRAAPGLRLHASTQMSVHNADGVRLLARAGFSRVVAGREVSRGQLREMIACSPAEIEVFVHGALCMSVSGQCYLSAMLGGRSGNRGMCAQPCRLPFAAPGSPNPANLSLKDLSLVEQIGALAEMGAASLKIEGRMKRPEYVAAATDICARAVQGETVTREEMERLRAVFSRGGFTRGYFEDRTGPAMFGRRSREDVLAMQDVLAGYRRLYAGPEPARVPVRMAAVVEANRPAQLTAADPEGRTATVFGPVPEPARTRPLDAQELQARLEKTGGTPFLVKEITVELGGGLSLPAAAVNGLRREALQELEKSRGRAAAAACEKLEFSTVSTASVENRRGLRIRLRHIRQLTPAAETAGAELIFLPPAEIAAAPARIRALAARGIRVGAELPRAVFGTERERLMRALRQCRELGVADALCGNLGNLPMAEEAGMAVHGDFGLNIANFAARQEIGRLGAVSCIVSFEAALRDAAAVNRREADAGPGPSGPGLSGPGPETGLIAYGRLPLMLTRNCPLKNGEGCAACQSGTGAPRGLTDRKHVFFPVVCFGGASELLNSRPLWMCDRKHELYAAGAAFAALYFSIESPDEVDAVLKAWREGAPAPGEFTRGLYDRGVE